MFQNYVMRVSLLITLLIVYASTVTALSCYECDSINNRYCGECFFGDDVKQVDCDDVELPENFQREPATGCLTKYYEGVYDQIYFIRRMCYYGDLNNAYRNCYKSPPDPLVPYKDLLVCQVCDDDLCNASAQFTSNDFCSKLLTFLMLLWIL